MANLQVQTTQPEVQHPPKKNKAKCSFNIESVAGSILPIDEFNKRFTPETVIKKFGYKKRRSGKWLHPHSKSGIPGVNIKDGKAFSHSDGDPLNDGFWHDAYDCERKLSGCSESEMLEHANSMPVNPDDPNSIRIAEHNRDVVQRHYRSKVTGDTTKLIRRIERTVDSIFEDASKYINWDVVRKSCTYAFVDQLKSKVLAINEHGDLPHFPIANFINEIRPQMYGSWFDYESLHDHITKHGSLDADETEKLIGKLYSAVDGEYKKWLLIYRQRSVLKYSTDMFATTQSLLIEDEYVCLISIHKPFPVGRIDNEIIEDYKQAFSDLDIFISLVASARFASDRKKAFYWLHAPSDWGKGFLMSVFKELGILAEMSVAEIEKAFEGAPVGKQAVDFKHCWILACDEFKAVKSEVKQLTSSLRLSPKNQMTCEVLLYMKLFMSAETVDSLAGGQGVEDQFANRFSSINNTNTRLDDRTLFTQSKTAYFESLKNYIAHKLNVHVDFYRWMGKTRSADIADKNLDDYNATHKLSLKYGSLNDSIEDIADDIRRLIISASQPFKTNEERYASERLIEYIGTCITGCEYDGSQALLVQYADKIIADYINDRIDRSERVKVGLKKSFIRDMLDDSRRANKNASIRVKIGGEDVVKKGILIKLV